MAQLMYRQQIVGPMTIVSASTASLYDVFKLLRLVETIKIEYGHDVYWPWLKDDILQPLL